MLNCSLDITQLYYNRQFATELDGAVKAEGRLDFAMFTNTAGRCVGCDYWSERCVAAVCGGTAGRVGDCMMQGQEGFA